MAHLSKGASARPLDQQKGFRIHLVVFLLATPLIWLAWYLTGTAYIWPLWQTPVWAIGLLFHYLGVFVFGKRSRNI